MKISLNLYTVFINSGNQKYSKIYMGYLQYIELMLKQRKEVDMAVKYIIHYSICYRLSMIRIHRRKRV